MNIMIQQADTREYLAAPPDDWVRDPHDALLFSDARAALAFCQYHRLGNVRLVVSFGKNKVSVLLYVPGASTLTPAGSLKAAAA